MKRVLFAVLVAGAFLAVTPAAHAMSACGGKKPENQPAYCTTTTTEPTVTTTVPPPPETTTTAPPVVTTVPPPAPPATPPSTLPHTGAASTLLWIACIGGGMLALGIIIGKGMKRLGGEDERG